MLFAPNNEEKLSPLRVQFYERLLMAMGVVPVAVLFLTYLSYMLLYGSLCLNSYTNIAGVFPAELQAVKTVLHGFAGSFIILTFIGICTLTINSRKLLNDLAADLLLSLTGTIEKNTVENEALEFLKQACASKKYIKIRTPLTFWKTKFPGTMLFSNLLFWLSSLFIFVCITQICNGEATAMMLLNPSVVAMMIYFVRLLQDDSFLIIRYCLSTYEAIISTAKQGDNDREVPRTKTEYSNEDGEDNG